MDLNIYASRLHYTLQNNRNVRTLYHQVLTNSTGNSDEIEIANYWSLTGIDQIAAVQADTLLWDCIEVQKIYNDADTIANSTVVNGDPTYININIPGTDSVNEALPGQCSLLIQSRTIEEPMVDRHQGRNFWTGFVETDQDNGEWLTARWDVIGDAIIDAVEDTNRTGFTSQAVNWSPTNAKLFNGAPVLANLPWTVVDEWRGIKQVRTQRRRQPLNVCDQYFGAPIP